MLFRFEQIVPAPRALVFAFHDDPGNLALLLRRRAGFRLLAHEGNIEPGSRTRVLDAWGPLPVAMTFEHVLYDPPREFAERLVHGPFRCFRHRHRFEALGEATRIVDELEVRLPWWLGGELGMRRVVGPHLRSTFDFRRAALQRLALEGRLAEPST